MKNDGTNSEEIFERMVKLQYPNAYLYRIADQKELSRGNKLKGVVTRATPSDYILTLPTCMVYAEVKSCSNDTSFPFSQFTPGQNLAMVRQKAAKGHYWIWIHNLKTDTWYFTEGYNILKARAEGKKSFKWSEMTQLNKGFIL